MSVSKSVVVKERKTEEDEISQIYRWIFQVPIFKLSSRMSRMPFISPVKLARNNSTGLKITI